ncbi:recombinase family protein [Spirillospora sp. CA-253888]
MEKSWEGFETHTEQGYNVGKPPYGYLAKKIPHPVPARRAEGASKHRLMPDSVRGPVVTAIFAMRMKEQLGYEDIAERLNTDLDRFPPPVPPDPARAVGQWTKSSVRDILTNPKYTGYMVWNRRAMKSNRGRYNPPEVWVWSSAPTHEPLVTLAAFVEAQRVAQSRQGSRRRSGSNTAHPSSLGRSYKLRSFITCALCQHRTHGKTRRNNTYYVCQPNKNDRTDDHPKSFWLREEPVLEALTEFFNSHVFGPRRRTHLARALNETRERTVGEHQAQLAAVQQAITDIQRRRRNLVRSLEEADGHDQALMNDIRERSLELGRQQTEQNALLAGLEQHEPIQTSLQLLDMLLMGTVDLGNVPEPALRRLLEAFRLKIRYDWRTGIAECQITLTGTAIQTQRETAKWAFDPGVVCVKCRARWGCSRR